MSREEEAEEPAASQESQEVKSGQTQPIVEDNADGASSSKPDSEASSNSQPEAANQEGTSQEVPIDSQKPTINNQ
ncbi:MULTISPECIES: hypothetical protein [Aerococcus]|uniref:Uncharacterized protein n=1 Tax=Aerococcus sanguinicola TaxID=119206 RepID=A0A0X8FB30_9LACT|nr:MULTISPECIES: hypothetical protein [Aerococcus]AMB94096.1 hypothetical protein AWM72_04655 [Aerococcus sanguinicola]OFT92947.1 hypothetical protein HMPREF3090_07780 [Aerococcus sp. HMSC23C02]